MENEKNLEEIQEEAAAAEETAPAQAAAPAEESAAEATTPAEDTAAQEASATEEAPAADAETPAEDQAAEAPAEEKKVTPGKLALVIAGIVVVIAVIVALLMGGKADSPAQEPGDAMEATESVATEPPATVPADGNPDDETCKGTYTVTDEEVIANRDTVVATIGDHTLTNGQLQVAYWMQVQSFLASEYGSYMMYYGALDYTQTLDKQVCAITGNTTWQQFFLKEALNSWQSYCALADKANTAGMELSEGDKEYLANMEENLKASAAYYGLETVDELMKYNVGAGAGMEEYAFFQELLMRGNLYYDAEYAKLTATQEELEAFFAEHESEYAESKITKDGKYVDVRHILFTPEGGTTDESGVTTYSDEEWAACEEKAAAALKEWESGEKTEDSFAVLATAMTQDPGSKETGGLYENVYEGQMVPEFEAWCFDETREPGHTGIVKTTYGYHVMYYVGSRPVWETYARQDLMTEKTNAMMSALVEQYPMEVDYSAITLGHVDMAA